LAVCLFLWASYHQHVCHRILADLRRDRKGQNSRKVAGEHMQDSVNYGRPNGDWFELVSCPHFFAEILIYASVLLCCVGTVVWNCWWLVLVYVVSTLGLSARQAHVWYQRKYEDYPKHRRAMIPWLW
jgi:3-oxo-5-alpha-steroid 4-dehydrogenase 3